MTAEEKLLKSYEKARAELQKKLETASSGNMRNYYRQLLKDLDKTIQKLKKASADYAKATVQSDYMQNAAGIFQQMTQQRQPMLPPEAFRQLHSDAIYDLRREMQTQLEQGLEKARQQTAQLIEDAATLARKTALRNISLDAAQHKVNTVGTISDMQQEVKRLMEKAGILKVEVGNGKHKREMSVTNYAHLVARSVSIEVGNTARINQLTANGYDLVEIPTHYPTCEICAILQDRVYSISGNDKRFPPLSKAIGVYKNIHPHCRHVIVGWVESMHTPEEVEEAIKRSNRAWTDPRTGEEKAFYNELQRKNRQARDLRSQYERYKERLGDDAPKSIVAFKRIKKAGGEKWENLQAQYRQASIDNSSNSKYNKYIELPSGVKEIGGMTNEIMDEISKALDKFNAEYELGISSSDIRCVSFGEGNENMPFRFSPQYRSYKYFPSLEINKDYYFEGSLDDFTKRIMDSYGRDILSSKSVEDLIAHEVAHILTFKDCITWEDFESAELIIRTKFVAGVSGYSNKSHDGAETIAEGFVRIRNNEAISEEVRKLIEQYVERWRK